MSLQQIFGFILHDPKADRSMQHVSTTNISNSNSTPQTINQTIAKPDDILFSVSVDHHNEGRATVSTSSITIHDQFLPAVRQLILEELSVLRNNP
jgi:hypothetical protein